MSGFFKTVGAFICLCIQIVIVVVYGFTEIPVSQYICLILWLACGVVGLSFLEKRHAV